MINNRQSGRRRGRGGGQRSPNNVPNAGNRQDNRQRGNAAQLHEKYKALARDAQLAGDRVQTEYYLQFADHYFRVLNEGRARFEEQRRQRDDFSDEGDDQDDGLMASDGDEQDEGEDRQDQPQDRPQRQSRPEQRDAPRDRGYRNGAERSRPRFEPAQAAAENDEADNDEDGAERISLEVLPPAISPDAAAEAPRAPRRRTRRPRAEGGEAEIAPAA